VNNQASIIINNLSIGYNSGNVTRSVAVKLSAVIRQGELTCLLGSNGSGKSTLLRTIAGLQPKLEGNILIENKVIESYSRKTLSKTVGVVLTEKTELREMTVRDLVGLGRNPYTGFWGRLNYNDEREINKAICSLRIESLADRSVNTLSDGERQKVMIAKALAQETPVIILDEPTAFLDFPSRVDTMRFLMRLAREENKTILISTHDLELALQTADRLLLLTSNSVITGTPEKLVNDGSIENFFPCQGAKFDPVGRLFRITGFNA
jgi:iron complex transport system ATP-binding protein